MEYLNTKAEVIKQLHERLIQIEEYCDGWKKCQDGSYEMALHNAGYDRVLDQLKQLKETV